MVLKITHYLFFKPNKKISFGGENSGSAINLLMRNFFVKNRIYKKPILSG